MKKLLAAFTLALLFAVVPVYASDISVTVEGVPVAFGDQPPVIVDGRTLVPVRGVFETLGFNVNWDGETGQATLTSENYTVVLTIGSAAFTTNGVSHTLEVPAQSIGGRTMLPIRAVLESVGYYLAWDGGARTVLISSAPLPVIAPPEPTPAPTPAPAPVPPAGGGFRVNIRQAHEWEIYFLNIEIVIYEHEQTTRGGRIIRGSPAMYVYYDMSGSLLYSLNNWSRAFHLTAYFYDSNGFVMRRLGPGSLRSISGPTIPPGESFNVSPGIRWPGDLVDAVRVELRDENGDVRKNVPVTRAR